MNSELRDFLSDVNYKAGYSSSDADLKELLMESKEVSRDEISRSRWYNSYHYVVEIDERFIQYTWFECTGDNSINDMGLEFDWGDVLEVFPKQIVTTIYVRENL
jgi:hypothetical protein